MPPRVPTTNDPREVEQWRLSLLGGNGFMLKVASASDGNIAEFLDGQAVDSGFSVGDLSQAANFGTITGPAYTVQATDGTIFIDASGGNVAIAMLSAASKGGREYIFKRIDTSSNLVTITADGAETIDGDSTARLFGLESMNMKSDDSNWWII